jgi:methionyl-tRNA formyltransferase
MIKQGKLRVVLFALTGFGNPVLEALLNESGIEVEAVFTVKYEHPFPYYEERQLIELCADRGVTCYYGMNVCSEEGVELLHKHEPDLVIVATFKQIIKDNVLRLPTLGVVNLHPSRLPRYRGPSPTNAVLMNDEKITGVTLHYVTEKLDEGNILLQKSIFINQEDNDGRLRQKLAKLAAEMIPEVVEIFIGFNKPAGMPQNNSEACYAPRPAVEDGYLELVTDIHTIRRKVRAYNPLPGTSILIGEERICVDRFEFIKPDRPDGTYENNNSIDILLNSQAIRLYKKPR